MNTHEDFIGSCLDARLRRMDRDKGLQARSFSVALENVFAKASELPDELGEGGVRKNPGTDIADPYGSKIKPKGIPAWDHAPVTPKEEAIYYGNHMHSESNPLGLHSHVPGGTLTGAHSHGPQNRFGAHHHKKLTPMIGITIDGSHTHDGENFPAGQHCHCPENFG